MNGKRQGGQLRVLFAGGGSGGHLMPAVAAARELRGWFPAARLAFLVASGRTERLCLPALAGYEALPVPRAPWTRPAQKALFPARAAWAACEAAGVIRAFRPRLVVGLGGSHCIAPVLAARALGTRVALLEANAVPGRAVRLLAPAADLVLLQWGRAARRLRARRTAVTGNPVRQELFELDRLTAMRRLGLSPRKRTLLVMGGSQGALALNAALREALPPLLRSCPDVQALHLTGPDHLPAARQWAARLGLASYRPIGFLQRMKDAYAAADFVLCRAGASTLAELTALGLPALLVPLPGAGAHQVANATVLAEGGAAITIRQRNLSPTRLARAIVLLATNDALRARMSANAARLGRPDAARRVARELAALAGFAEQDKPPTGHRELLRPGMPRAA